MQAAKPQPERHDRDYAIDDVVVAESPETLKALVDPTRTLILDLLLERAATTSQLAATLGKPKGTVGYHLKVLEEAGLVRVVRTRPVRAMVEKYYGRTGRTIVVGGLPEGADKAFLLRRVLDEIAFPANGSLPAFTVRRARIPEERAAEFFERVVELAEDFVEQPRGGDTVFGFVAGVYPTEHPSMREEDA